MELNIQINPEDVNKLVAEAVLKSSIGVQVERIINEHVAKLSQSYNNPIERVVEMEVQRIVVSVLSQNHMEAIKKRVTEALALKLSDEFIGSVIEKGLRNY